VVIAVLAGFVLLQQYFLLTRSWCPKCDCPKPEHVKSDFAAKRFVAKPPQQPLQQPSVQHLDTLPRPVVEHKPAPPTTVLTTTPAVLKPRFAPDLKPLKIYQPYAACYGVEMNLRLFLTLGLTIFFFFFFLVCLLAVHLSGEEQHQARRSALRWKMQLFGI
jgi:hypothetical protein